MRWREFIAGSVARSMPAISFIREFVTAGGLMSYGGNNADPYRMRKTPETPIAIASVRAKACGGAISP
jgi:hypothetical protein